MPIEATESARMRSWTPSSTWRTTTTAGPSPARVAKTFVLSSGYYEAYYRRAQKLRTLIRQDFETVFSGDCDVVATPTAPDTAFAFGEKTAEPLQMYLADIFTVPASLAGIPGVSLPCGLAEGLPVGLQLLGPAFTEAALLRAAHALEQATDHHRLAPPV